MSGTGESRATGAATKFRLLMWKNFLQQWRHRVQTVVEVLLPVLSMSSVLILRSEIQPLQRSMLSYHTLAANSLQFAMPVFGAMNHSHLSIAYSPKSSVLEEVLTKATAKLLSENSNYIKYELAKKPNLGNIEIKVVGFDNSDSMRRIYSAEYITRIYMAAVEFDDELSGATALSGNLKYYLRFPERPRQYSFFSIGSQTWETDLSYPYFQAPGPRWPDSWEGGHSPGYVNEMFIALQQLLSMELIAKATNQDLSNFRVVINRFPHNPYIFDQAVEALEFLVPMFMMISFSYTAVNLVRAVTVEKELQLKETMKIMGLPTWLHWAAWFCKQFIFLLIISIMILILLKAHWFKNKYDFSEFAVFTNTPWSLILFFLLLYSACTIFFCFMISGFFSKGSTAALFTGVIWSLTYLPAFILMSDIQISAASQAVLCLSINTAMAFGFQLMLVEENAGGLQWGQIWSATDLYANRFVFGIVVMMLIVDCVLYMLVALYLEQVFPGLYGAPKPWNFVFQKHFWRPNTNATAAAVNVGTTEFDLNETQYVVEEKVSGGHTIGVKMTNLIKVFGDNIAVNNFSLDIYDDQITVLLGHNGAGKSTTMAMLTGNLKPTNGSVWLAGYDMAEQTEAARANLGFCPQHNVLFNELTVREHLEFFGRLKGFTGQELQDDIDTLITKLEMDDKRDYQAAGLSGGQKRRLSVGIALSGAPRVVLLDEPTSGMDPASRRALWDLLQKEKTGRSMILTTHFMDEADILGDRVAIMSTGKLQCVGSPYFLKRHYGVGYTLVVEKGEGFKTEACTQLINRHIPGVTVKEDRGTEVTYSLTNDKSHLFQVMLDDLEKNKNSIKFKNYGLTATTLEDVFMAVGSDLIPHTEDESDEDINIPMSRDENADIDVLSTNRADRETLKGVQLWKQHVLAVWFKLWLVWTRSWVLLLMHVLVPLALINLSLGILQWVMSVQPTVVARELTLAKGFAETETLLAYNGTSESSLGGKAKAAYENLYKSANIHTMKLTVLDKQDISQYYLQRTTKQTDRAYLRHRMLIGATFDDSSATAWFSNFGYHDVAISLNTIHQAILKALIPDGSLRNNMQSYVSFLTMQLSSGIGSSLAIISAIFIMFYIKERILRAKLLQKAAGIQPSIMWGSAALFDWAWYLVLSLIFVISCAAYKVMGLSTVQELGRMYVALMVYGAAMLPLHYLMSHVFSGPATGFVTMFFFSTLFGQLLPQVVEALLDPELNTAHMARTLDNIMQIYPLYSLVRSVTYLNQAGLNEWSCMQTCDYLLAVLPNVKECTMQTMCQNNYPMCCVEDDSFFGWKKPGILRYLVCMLLSCVVLWTLLMFVEYNIHQKICQWTKRPPPLDESTMDEDVVAEIRRVESVDIGQPSLVAKGLSKYYKKHLAVNQVSFSKRWQRYVGRKNSILLVSDAEVFGLLGVNGAGKTTTFKMLIGDELISSGEAYVCGYSVKTEITSARKNIGYCPQFDAILGELTGRETLKLFWMLRGLPRHESGRAFEFADLLGFTKHLDKRVEQYSGGNKRKLSTAVALLGFTRLVFVDEPTTGVDPAAKRQVWRVISDARRAGRAVVLTSHSMEECEALCSRLTIMVNGQFQCLGTPQHLKNKFSQGFTLRIKMQMSEESTDKKEKGGPKKAGARGIEAVKRFVETNFTNPKLMEEYRGLLTYYLPDRNVAWSRMFGIMERCRRDHDVEDYTILQTTLEQIFLQFTKYQRDMEQ